MNQLSNETLQSILELAEKATQEKWMFFDRHGLARIQIAEPGHETFHERICEMTSSAFRGEQAKNDGLFIQAANPETVKAIVTELMELRKDRERLEWMIEQEGFVDRSNGGFKVYGAREIPFNKEPLRITASEAIDAAMGGNNGK